MRFHVLIRTIAQLFDPDWAIVAEAFHIRLLFLAFDYSRTLYIPFTRLIIISLFMWSFVRQNITLRFVSIARCVDNNHDHN